MRQVLAWEMGRDREAALRLAAALKWWWLLRGRLSGVYPVDDIAGPGPGPRGSRGCPPVPGRRPRAGLSGRGGVRPGAPRGCRRGGRRPGRGGAAGPAGRSGPRRHRSLDSPVVPHPADRCADPSRRLRRRRAGLRGRAGRVPGRGRPEGPAVPAVLDGAAGPAGRPRQRRRGAAARSHPAICAGRRRDLEQYYLDYCGYLCAATGRPAEAVTMWAAHAALTTRENLPGTARHRGSRCARPGRRWDRPGFGPPSSAARR